ncbi:MULTISPECIES: hypothetical protein [unclassified Thalassospira]|uniref:hypothetical protein n=1 Tax=unclassified Thalassospira TaxID=2648997 RepID=UPI0007A58227|nr:MULTISPECIES: hypothetical protein [unclassified Thalassospira]KZD00953.1 hypothetical protein AUQ41_04185 [Thalassospira sp. MCCC 1A02898]ONH88288.1 hypothetical protein TH47_06670 [Thalassospira sp. MCCC 1A02803]
MSIESLKMLRLITPGVMCLLFIIIFGHSTGFYKIEFPSSVRDLDKSLAAICIAFVYQILPIRKWSNKPFQSDIAGNIRDKMREIYGVGAPELSNKDAMTIFYNFVDNDESLKIQAKIAYFNGYIWSSVADFRALTLIFCLLSIVCGFFVDNVFFNVNALAFGVLFACSFFVSYHVTAEHKKISDNQMRTIKNFYREKLISKMDELSGG